MRGRGYGQRPARGAGNCAGNPPPGRTRKITAHKSRTREAAVPTGPPPARSRHIAMGPACRAAAVRGRATDQGGAEDVEAAAGGGAGGLRDVPQRDRHGQRRQRHVEQEPPAPAGPGHQPAAEQAQAGRRDQVGVDGPLEAARPVSRSRPMRGGATLTTVESSIAMAEPRTVVNSSHLPWGEAGRASGMPQVYGGPGGRDSRRARRGVPLT
ncbi:hypothetical protein Srubr_61900 [Streptomyces rubradiris]|uniref:Uncharacterized protein n=1 Tax=Streptomyces rubradiris TaxID=285531 RepID=A0ABQ3RKF7_STRRR|nr:hypothetical protein Srubr_61900 [Streptomyces rubradiris]